jgi:hypothetical protein
LALGHLGLARALGTGGGSEGKRPNIVLILADDVGYGDVGYHGWDDVVTPNIDKLAAEGVSFSNAYVTVATSARSTAGRGIGPTDGSPADFEQHPTRVQQAPTLQVFENRLR